MMFLRCKLLVIENTIQSGKDQMKLSPTPWPAGPCQRLAARAPPADDHYQLHINRWLVMIRRNRRVVAVLSLVIVALLLFQQFSYDAVSKSGSIIAVSGPTLAS